MPTSWTLVDQLWDFRLADHDDGPGALEIALPMAPELLQGFTHQDYGDECHEIVYT